ncbi:MAG: hypothetical protein HYZ59_01615, partial [Actinobacteria bacterium]|nr:hypothetical protein [Actinomycetota bacterium]
MPDLSDIAHHPTRVVDGFPVGRHVRVPEKESPMSRWTMSRRLAAGFLAVVLMSMGVSTFLMNRMGRMDSDTKVVLATSDRIKVALDAHEALIALGRAALISIITANPAVSLEDDTMAQRGVTETEAAVKRMVDGVAKLRSSASGDPAEMRLLDQLSANASELKAVLAETEGVRATQGGGAATQVLVAKGAVVSDAGQALLDKMVKVVEASQTKAAKTSANSYSRSRNLSLLLSGLTTLLAALIAWRVSRSVSRSVGRGAVSVSTSAGDLGAVSAQMSANAMETAMQADVVSGAAGRVSDSVQTVASAVEEMTASVREIAQNAGEASKVAEQAVEVAEATNATVSKLGVSSAEIGEVIAVITSIAEQTNLLALNATIEA